ncbi:MAG: SDR family oxidoreductase [Anaerolineae bacterium]|nr:SDR family oxidoreductase [Anaerolineae bacterium]MDK1080026.1 SDR family oxidoreductase [Anaerolineae bacterium]
MKFKDKVAIITGATKGIGEACAHEFAKEGAKVVVVGRTKELGNKVVADIQANGGTAMYVEVDISQKAEVDAMVAQVVDTYDTVDIVVNNAGVNHSADFFDITEEDWDWVMSVDLKGTFFVSQAAARVMVDQDKPGAIVNVSSVMAQLALANQIPYCAAKGGVNQLTKAMALSLVDRNIQVNCCAPGPVMTELMERVVNNEQKKKQLMDRLPIGRIATTKEIARVIIFLASEEAAFLVGQTIYPDGGRSIQAFPRRLEK